MKKPLKTRIKCSTDGTFHTVEFHKDGNVTSSGCPDLKTEAERLASMLRLGKAPAKPDTCVALAALVLHGCEIILRRPADDDGVIRDLSGWRDIYVRFETNKVVEATMKRVRKELKTRGRPWRVRKELKRRSHANTAKGRAHDEKMGYIVANTQHAAALRGGTPS